MIGAAVLMALLGQRYRSPELIRASRRAVTAVAALMTLATVSLLALIFINDYTIIVVQKSSSRTLPWYFKLSLLWVNLESSMLFWAWILSLFAALAVHTNRSRLADLIPNAIVILMLALAFWVYLLMFLKNPFDQYLAESYVLGDGMRVQLRNPWMLIHPPVQYLGYIATTVPFAFCLAALLRPSAARRREVDWVTAMRTWILAAWLLLGGGLVLGMVWAYELIDWGGWWSWDPVENAALIPWFTATALVHSVLILTRRGMLKGWTVFLTLTTFWLTIMGTFMTRSGVVRSVHSFGEDKAMIWAFGIFMVLGIVLSYGVLIARLTDLSQAKRRLSGLLSLETGILLANWVLFLSALFVLTATLYPTLHEWMAGTRVTVGPPFFQRYMAPLGFTLLALTAVAPLLTWRGTSLGRLGEQLFWPFLAMIATLVGLSLVWPDLFPFTREARIFGGVYEVPVISLSKVTIGISGLLIAAAVQHLIKLSRARARAQREHGLVAIANTLRLNRLRYGAYLAHVGVALMYLGFAGKPLVVQRDAALTAGDHITVAGTELEFAGLISKEGTDRTVTQAVVLAREAGHPAARALTPGQTNYLDAPRQPVSEAVIISGLGRDLHVRLAGWQGQQVSLKVAVHPLVSWLWIGFGVMAVGAIICMIPGLGRRKKKRGESPEADRSARSRRLAWAVAGAALVALAAYLVLGTDHRRVTSAVALWVVGATVLAAAFGVFRSFWPLARPSTTADDSPDVLEDLGAGERDQWIFELRRLDDALDTGKITAKQHAQWTREAQLELARILARQDAESKREAFRAEVRKAKTAKGKVTS